MKRSTILILSAVLIAAVVSGCMQETSEIGAPGGAPQPDTAPPAATPDAAQPVPASEVTPSYMSIAAPPLIANWKYVSYRNLSISNAPALNQTARITYSIIPDRDIEVLFVYLDIPDGFELMDVEGTWPRTLHNITFRDVNDARWFPTNLSKDKMYQFNTTIKAVETGNWTVYTSGGKKEIYLSVSEDSAYISDKPFPKPPIPSICYFLDESELNESEIEKALANIPINSNNGITVYQSNNDPINATTTPSKPPKYNITLHPTPCPTSCSLDVNLDEKTYAVRYYWNGTAWVERNNQS